MENAVELHNVTKSFKGFQLKDISFTVKKGFVTGFIGANGAGKSSTIKLIMNLLKKDSGTLTVFGKDHEKDELWIKERIGFVYDDSVFYEEMTIRDLKKFIAPAYQNWDESKFQKYLDAFELPEKKRISSMSKGMKMKTSLMFALSHHAELIIMDEPTSGLDPVFRRELLDLLFEIMQDQEKSIFFSTHITTDLDRIADYLIFIHNGRIIFNEDVHSVFSTYGVVKGDADVLTKEVKSELTGIKETKFGFEALTSNADAVRSIIGREALIEKPTLEDIMYFTKRGEAHV
ncbi:ATP-binding cassette domain-containing protein [Bacillus mangrovi]|uniref:ATP-binding cassette domain-containing protein n=1 Tax=Metabacillus mangrovi TaxID=1491830 RepID=A0A7X2S5R0_9BACI|nr:ABC transporter ATP-binding protein [Metabacillus mangrovi]MTH53286.1 ATP-binding cassette domain-containing protein [Metabacillus mangrovi]